jgi:tripeptide aminopeptidase
MGGADNHQFNKNGINGIVLSCGMQKVHTTEEYIEIADLEAGADLVAELLSADLKEIT